MELIERIEEAEKGVENHKKYLKQYESSLEKLKKCTQPTNKELYDNMERYFTYQIINRRYKFILGGDGRSAPWDEIRTGEVGEVLINENLFLSGNQLQIVFQYIKSQFVIDHIETVKKFTN